MPKCDTVSLGLISGCKAFPQSDLQLTQIADLQLALQTKPEIKSCPEDSVSSSTVSWLEVPQLESMYLFL